MIDTLKSFFATKKDPKAIYENLSILEGKQVFFARCVGRLISDAMSQGYLPTFGEAWRSPETCSLYQKEGKGIKNSLHQQRLAVDLNFFKEGKLLTTAREFEPLGRLWESYSEGDYRCTAGVFFAPNPDSDHFSVEHLGTK